MKTLTESLNESLNEKAYQLVRMYAAKGIPGKMQFPFKKRIEKTKFTDVNSTLSEINKEWDKFKKEAEKIINDEVFKIVNKNSIAFITATINDKWELDTVNKENKEDGILVRLGIDFVINVGFMDDVNSAKYKNRLGGYNNSPLFTKGTIVTYGDFDEKVHDNNVVISTGMFLWVDRK